MTQTSKLDLTRPDQRGFTLGLNEFSGYVGVAVAGIVTGYLATGLGPRMGLFVFGTTVIVAALVALLAGGIATLVQYARAEANAARFGQKATEFDQSTVFKKIYEEEFGTFGGASYGCLIGDYAFGNHPQDMALLEKMSQVAAAARKAGVRKLILASSSSVYGVNAKVPFAERDPIFSAISPYAASKFMNEIYADTFATAYGFGSIGLRYFNVYGPRQNPESEYAAVVPRFVVACLAGRAPTIYGDGEQTRDFTYVDDAVDATLLAAIAPRAEGEVFNAGTDEEISVIDAAIWLAGGTLISHLGVAAAALEQGLGLREAHVLRHGIVAMRLDHRGARDGR